MSTLRAALGIALVPAFVVVACTREADIVDEIDAGVTATPTFAPDADIEPLDAALGSDAFAACESRPVGQCVGSNDFPCAFSFWVQQAAKKCHEATGCEASGWLEVTMGAEGCVTEIGMEQPEESVVACLVAELGTHRCPCSTGTVTHLFVSSPDCTPPCGSGEFPCPAGLVCNAEQKCVKG